MYKKKYTEEAPICDYSLRLLCVVYEFNFTLMCLGHGKRAGPPPPAPAHSAVPHLNGGRAHPKIQAGFGLVDVDDLGLVVEGSRPLRKATYKISMLKPTSLGIWVYCI